MPPASRASSPSRAARQRREALAKANEIRRARAALKQALASGGLQASEALTGGDSRTDGMAVGELVRAQRGIGRERSRRLLARLGISESRPVGQLTGRQREALASELSRRESARAAA